MLNAAEALTFVPNTFIEPVIVIEVVWSAAPTLVAEIASEASESSRPAATSMEATFAVNEADLAAVSKLPSRLPEPTVEPKVISAVELSFIANAHAASAAHLAVTSIDGDLISRPVIGVEFPPTTLMAISRAPFTFA